MNRVYSGSGNGGVVAKRRAKPVEAVMVAGPCGAVSWRCLGYAMAVVNRGCGDLSAAAFLAHRTEIAGRGLDVRSLPLSPFSPPWRRSAAGCEFRISIFPFCFRFVQVWLSGIRQIHISDATTRTGWAAATASVSNFGVDVWNFMPACARDIVRRAGTLPVNVYWEKVEPRSA